MIRPLRRALLAALAGAALGCGGDEPPPKVLLLGLDGATFDLLDPWMEAGELPNLAALRAEGVSGTLLSVLPPLSPPAWATLSTGVNPGAHGIFDFYYIDREDDVGLTVTGANRRAPGFWTFVDEAGLRTGVLNVPVTDPPDRLQHGFLVAGFPHADSTGYAHPPELEERLHAEGYRIDRMGGILRDGEEQELQDEILATLDARIRAARELGAEHPDLDLYFVVFTATDRVQHFFWKFMEEEHPFHDPALAGRYGDAILRVWREVDAAVGELVAQARAQAAEQGRECVVMVVSDHGFSPVHRSFRPQSFLRNPPDGSEPITSTFSLEQDGSLLYIPRAGREDGGLPADEHEALGREILDRVEAARDPRGGQSPAVLGARREDLYTGRYVSLAPDLVFLPRPGYNFISEKGDKEPFGTPRITYSAHHSVEGIVILSGPMVRAGTIEGRQNLLDVAPTVLHTLGLSVPGYMEGRVLTDLFRPEWLRERPVRVDGRAAEEVGGDGERIRAIPYVQ